MAAPDYLICVECESPVYVFEWQDDAIAEAICLACGNDEVEQFLTPEAYEELAGG